MSVLKIAWRSIQQRALASSLTATSMALGVALVICVLTIHGVVKDSFSRGAEGYHLVVGKKGSDIQLVMNTVFHLSKSMEPLPWRYYKEFLTTDGKPGKYARYVETAIPYCLGDNFQDYRVVATVPELFEKLRYAGGKSYEFKYGRNFQTPNYFEAVAGALAARRLGLKVGDKFRPTHSVAGGPDHGHDEFEVVGILAPTGTPNDRALFINMEGFYLTSDHAKPLAEVLALEKEERELAGQPPEPAAEENANAAAPAANEHANEDEHGHDHDERKPLPEIQREVTAILVLAKGDTEAMILDRMVNEGLVAQSASPIRVIATFFKEIVAQVHLLMLVLTSLIIVVAGIGVMVSIYNSMSERRHEIAIMRSLGARRGTILSVVLLESILLALGGGVLGFLAGHALIGALSPLIVNYTGITLSPFVVTPQEAFILPALVALAAITGYFPARSAYNTDVAKALSASP